MSLYCKEGSAYSATLQDLLQLMESLKAKWDVETRIVTESLTPDVEQEIKASLRNLPPQRRGEIVTKRGDMLPLTGKKNLNLENTPILLVEINGTLTNVFPKRMEDRYTDVRSALVKMLEVGVHAGESVQSPENLARSRLVDELSAIESGLEFVGVEFRVTSGFIDLLLKDAAGRFLVVELKREAGDATIGQVLRLWASLAQDKSVDRSFVRKMIVCARINSYVELAATSAGIEIRRNPSLFH